ncbi:MAG: hypothetical protein HY275_13920 [Gemmatimonadetes bacterium]|nr:hypothetical protein [Gemmatimonadota bacterium]
MPAPRPLPLVLLAALAACGGAADQKAATDKAAQASVAPPLITVTAKDFAFEMPDTVTGGLVTVKLVNQGPELHHVQFLKLDDGHTYAVMMEGMKKMKPTDPPPPWVHDVAGPNAPVPGGTSTLTTTLAPGNYAVVCFVDTPDHVPHLMKGMAHPLTVVAPTGAPAAAPASDVAVTMTDYAWDVAPALTKGAHVLKVKNAAAQSHEMFIVKLDEGKTADDLVKWAETYKGKPPATPLGGISAMGAGGEAYLSLDLAPGNYVFLCFVPDAKDGKPHLMHGMMKTFTIS